MAYVIGNDCIACGACIDECPVGAISEGGIRSIGPEACTKYGTYAEVYPNGAISLPGQKHGMSEDHNPVTHER